jgi:hypothetical protein
MTGELDIYGHGLSPDVDSHIIEAVKSAQLDVIRYYQYNLSEMTQPETAHLQTTLNQKLGKEIILIDSKEHDLNKWSVFEGF